MNEELLKSLSALIDETLAEVEELKKSDRFSASEIKIEGPGSGIAGKPVNGSMGKNEDEDEDEEEDEEEDEDEMDKAEGQNRQADPNGGNHQVVKDESGMPKGTMAKQEGQMDKAEGQNRQADPNGGNHQVVKAEDKDDDDDKKKDAWKKEMKKSAEEANTLLKSYVDERLAPIESKLESIMSLVKQVADSPVQAKGVSYRNISPLKKSDDGEGEPLTKSEVSNKLFELKKSGTRVDSVDIAACELATPSELNKIVQKYNIK